MAYFRNSRFLRSMWSGPAYSRRLCEAVLTWGFTDAHSWIPDFTKGVMGAATVFDESYHRGDARRLERALNEVVPNPRSTMSGKMS